DTIIEKITKDSVENVMHNSMIPYAEHVIKDRALPRVEDGLKPVQRRILFTMHELGLTPDKPHRKCARIVGDCLGKYHPHGESSVYDALTRMAQDFIMREKLVDGHGNFGSIDGDSPAAMRYTEAKMTPLALEMLKDLDKNTVPFVLNFEDELKEPDILPSKYPNLLVNGASGIAVGLATNIPPHNLAESIDATIAMLKNPEIKIESLIKILKGPDFPTGGIVLEIDELCEAYKTGRGKIKLRGKINVENSSAGRKLLVISEIPYQVSKSVMLEKIQRLTISRPELFNFIYSIRDESDRSGIRAVIEIKKDYDPEMAINLLYKYSDLQTTFGINIVAIAEGKPKQLNLKEVLFYYIKHQKNVTLNKAKYEVEKNKTKAHIMQGLIIALNNIDEVIKLIKESKTPTDAKKKLAKKFNFTEVQAQAILEIRLQRLTNLEIKTLKLDYEKLLKIIDELEQIINDEKVLISTIIKELLIIKKNNISSRRTIISSDEIEHFDDESF
ncbi:MAG: DNA topoisomerase 4 subunit A, partial [Christensenellaceae bacterium]|nr:DNA topoisomerase 4 subunit A [Christensenellaceae bacterium]